MENSVSDGSFAADGSDSPAAFAAKAINALARTYGNLRRRPAMFDHAVAISTAVGFIVESTTDDYTRHLSEDAVRHFFPSMLPKVMNDGSKYPWSALKEKGDRFLYEPTFDERKGRIRMSIAAAASKRFGPGAVSTQIVKSGVLVILQKTPA